MPTNKEELEALWYMTLPVVNLDAEPNTTEQMSKEEWTIRADRLITAREKVAWAKGYDQGCMDSTPKNNKNIRSKDYNLGYHAGYKAGEHHAAQSRKNNK